jgi:ABC-type branched-subunit amino acid transport system substrate-binding protein
VGSAVYGYEAMRLVLGAIRRAGAHGNDRAAVTRAAFGAAGRDSPLGPYAIDVAGDTSLHAFAVYAIRGGRLGSARVVEPPGG